MTEIINVSSNWELGGVEYLGKEDNKIQAYTIGAIINLDTEDIVLIHKKRPAWQHGLINLPGGHTEINETPNQCIAREIFEECDLTILPDEWHHVGTLENVENYKVDLLTTLYSDKCGLLKSKTDEPVFWCKYNHLPSNCLSNLKWLIPFCINYWQQGNNDNLNFGSFIYKNIQGEAKNG